VGVEDGERGIAILEEGLYEYEQRTDDRNTLALTLLRSTGRITDTYENEANMTEGWTSPEGFCLGTHESRLAVVPYVGNHVDAAIPARSQGFLSPVKAVVCPVDYNKFVGGRPFVQASDIPDIFYRPLENADKTLPAAQAFLTVTAQKKDAMILSALKGAEDGRGIIVRVFNSASEEMPFTIRFAREIASADRVNLNEEYMDFLTVEGGHTVSLTAKPKQILTLRVVLR
jgi:alpha-mannosidase